MCLRGDPSAVRPIVDASWLDPGQHLTAKGSDAEHKNEIDPMAITRAEIYVADSLKQTRRLGEVHHAIGAPLWQKMRIFRSSARIVIGARTGRRSASDITIADFYGNRCSRHCHCHAGVYARRHTGRRDIFRELMVFAVGVDNAIRRKSLLRPSAGSSRRPSFVDWGCAIPRKTIARRLSTANRQLPLRPGSDRCSECVPVSGTRPFDCRFAGLRAEFLRS